MSLINTLINEDIKHNPELKEIYNQYDRNLEYAIEIMKIRKGLGYSQKTLAKKVGIPQTKLKRIEQGEIEPEKGILRLIQNLSK